jgi:ribose transport system ATP-binding protein
MAYVSRPARDVLLRVSRVSKTFGQTTVLQDVSLQVAAGEVVALLGHNGSGKSTLVKILAGVHEPDRGSEIIRGGNERIHFIHQDLGLVNSLTAVENLRIVDRPGWAALAPLAHRRERREAEEHLARFGAKIDVTQPVARLSAAERAVVAVARALQGWDGSGEVLVLDEPTAALHRHEVETLFETVRQLASRGAGVIFITHRLDEVVRLADRVVVLRDGRVVADLPRLECDHDSLVKLIGGENAEGTATRQQTPRRGTAVLRARGIRATGIAAMDVDLVPGEIAGVSGNLGSGRDRVSAVLFGASESEAGEVWIDGQLIPRNSPRAAIEAGVAYVPGDRVHAGSVMTLTARENMTLPGLRPLQSKARRLRKGLERREVAKWFNDLGVTPVEPERPLRLFSGGNQQKVVVGKWLRMAPKVLLLDEPTAGVDVGARSSIYKFIRAAARNGTAVLICSSDTEELVMLADRVLVMCDGVVTAELAGSELSETRLIGEGLGSAERRTEVAGAV